MDESLEGILHPRIDTILKELCECSGEYALAAEKRGALREAVAPILHHNGELTITTGDCLNLLDLFDTETLLSRLGELELYRRGCLDCVKLLRCLGVLA